ncbi:MAG: hypothetical protein AB8H79_24645, partial [Myxococcota bacterium]
PSECEGAPSEAGAPIVLADLGCWVRSGEPVLRDPIPEENYQSASDGHVFRDQDGTLRMVYSGDVDGASSIKLATGSDWQTWQVTGGLLTEVGPSGLDRNKETSFYRLATDGTHQIYYIGYNDEDEYKSQIYLAEASAIEGPYTLADAPIVRRGPQDGKEVYLMTSPSVVAHENVLYMAYLGWDAPHDAVTAVHVYGVTSTDDGRTWSEPKEVAVPIGMEGQITAGPDGRFYAVALADFAGGPGISLGVADAPFGPYEMLDEPILVKQGAPHEVDDATAPQITFDESNRTARLYYVGVDYATGWWMMMASTRY